MRLVGSWSLGICLIAFAVVGQASDHCDDVTLQRCIQPIVRYKPDVGNFDVSKLRHACSLFPDVRKCVLTVGNLDNCDSAVYLQWVSAEAAIGYSCGEGLKDVELVAPCMHRPTVQRRLGACKFEFKRQFCRSIKQYIQCMGHTAHRYCGGRAGNLTLNLAIRVADATAKASGLVCTENKHTGSIRLAIGLSISVILVMIALVGVVVWAKKKHDSRKQQSLLHNDFLQMQGDEKD